MSDNPDAVEWPTFGNDQTAVWPHKTDDDYATKIEKLYELPKDGAFVDEDSGLDSLTMKAMMYNYLWEE